MEKMKSSINELALALKNMRAREEHLIYESVQKERERIAIELKEKGEIADNIAELTRLSLTEVEGLEINEFIRLLYVSLERSYEELKKEEAKNDALTNNEQERRTD